MARPCSARWWRAAPAILAIAFTGVPLSGCGSGGPAQIQGRSGRKVRDSRAHSLLPREHPEKLGILTYGAPAGTSDVEAVDRLVHVYMSALSSDNGGAACEHLARPIQEQALALNPRTTTTRQATCSGLMSEMFATESRRARARQRHTSISAVRVSGRRAFVFIREFGMPLQFFPLFYEDGAWRMGSIGPSILPTTRLVPSTE